MSRTTILTFVSLSLAFIALPLSLGKPGLPMSLAPEEASHYLAALSVAHDRDLRCDAHDLGRLFREFPYGATSLALQPSRDATTSPVLPVPWLYAVLMAPIVAKLGANGMIAANVLLTIVLVVLAVTHLRQHNDEGVAVLFGAGFVVASPLFYYAFKLQSATLGAVAVTLGLTLCGYAAAPELEDDDVYHPTPSRLRRLLTSPMFRAVFAGLLFAVAAHIQITLALLTLPALGLLRRESPRAAVVALSTFAIACVATIAVSFTLGNGLIGDATKSFVLAVDDPRTTLASLNLETIRQTLRPTTALALDFDEFAHNAIYTLVGRHTGLLIYYPFILLTLGLFAVERDRRSRLYLLFAVAGIALIHLVVAPLDWAGTDAVVANPSLLAVYPAFVFLARRVRPTWLPLVGYALAGLLIGPLMFGPFGLPAVGGHTFVNARHFPVSYLPLELTLFNRLTDQVELQSGDIRINGRVDQVMFDAESIQVRGGARAELLLWSPRPVANLVVMVDNITPHNRIDLDLGAAPLRLTFAEVASAGETRRIELPAGRWARARDRLGVYQYVRRLLVTTQRGQSPSWTDSSRPEFYEGARLTVLGDRDGLAADYYAVTWLNPYVPFTVDAGSPFLTLARLRNDSETTWPATGPARVNLSYHWLDDAGNTIEQEGRRTALAANVEVGQTLELAQWVVAPNRPGCYQLVLDPVLERVAWFSTMNPQATYRTTVEVVEPIDVEATFPPSAIKVIAW